MSSETFHLFPKLPIELRRMIWAFALPGPRQIKLFTKPDACLVRRKSTKGLAPIILSANREAREVALRHYETWHNADAFGYQYIDFAIDGIYFEAVDFEMPKR